MDQLFLKIKKLFHETFKERNSSILLKVILTLSCFKYVTSVTSRYFYENLKHFNTLEFRPTPKLMSSNVFPYLHEVIDMPGIS